MLTELSTREREVARLVAHGLTNGEIGDRLGISVLTAKWHVSEILRKVGVARRVQLAVAVHEADTLGPEHDLRKPGRRQGDARVSLKLA